jgi:hypothetical protein
LHFDIDGQQTQSAPRNIRLTLAPRFLVLLRTGWRNGQEGQGGRMTKPLRGIRHTSGGHFRPPLSSEVILVSHLILVANFLSEVDMVAWVD